jgi:hypothetical protein
MPTAKPASRPLAFDLRVSLQFIQPEIWRLIRVPHDIRMDRLHDVLQAAFGWEESHLHQFHLIDAEGGMAGYVGRTDLRGPFDYLDDGPKMQDETKRLLKNFLERPGDRIGYEYDFGDSWLHAITLATVEPQASRLTRAACLEGARSGPPEDCGGPPGYEHLLKVLKKPRHPERAEMIEWLGDDFDPTAFDPAAINRELARMKV